MIRNPNYFGFFFYSILIYFFGDYFMKKVLILFFLISIIFFTSNIHAVREKAMKKIIFLDSGHGSQDGGCNRDGILEKDLNLAISFKIKEVLEENKYQVLMTRYDDSPLTNPFHKKEDTLKRVKMINESDADLFISIHINHFSDSKYYGAQVFYFDSNKHNILIAKYLQDELSDMTNTKRNIKSINTLVLLKKVNKPGCLLECGFLSNDIEFRLLQTERYQKLLAECVLNAVNNYYLMV